METGPAGTRTRDMYGASYVQIAFIVGAIALAVFIGIKAASATS